ncbi:MAG: division/cell wall cluster transcriptional repressor MraZ [bacterium]
MFIGEFSHSVDDKSRVAIPVKFRSDLAQGAVISRGLDNCLTVYPKNEWEKLADKISKLPLAQKSTRAFTRFLLASAMDVKLDRQGRVVIPDYLKKYGKIKKKVVVAGLYNRLEIWDEISWNKYRGDTEAKSTDIAETLGELGI